MSYRAPTRYPGIPVHVISHRDAESRNTGKGRYPQATLYWTPHRVRGDEPVIPHLMRNPVNTGKSTHKIHFPLRSLTGPRAATRGDGICSFFSAARRTNQEAPPLLSGFVGRRLAPSSGAAELAALRQSSPSLLGRLASSRPDKGGVYRYDAEAWAYCTWRGVDVIPRPRNTRSCPTALRRGIQRICIL